MRSMLFVLGCLVCVNSQTTTRPTTPKEFPPEEGPPKDMKNCRLNANALMPWVVGVWDTGYRLFSGHGSMITYISFLTTCRQYSAPASAYRAVAQYIWNSSLPEQPCMQVKSIAQMYKHPKCVQDPKLATFFDFTVMRMTNGWDITGPSWPTVSFPSRPYDLFIGIRYVNVNPNTIGCILAYFKNQHQQPPVFDFKSFVQVIPFHSKCVKLLCEKSPPDEKFSAMCGKRLGERAKATMLCFKNKEKEAINFGVGPHPYWYAGAPVVCNGSVLGMAAQAKDRSRFPSPDNYDIHFVVTPLRVWYWLMEMDKNNSAPWAPQFFIEDIRFKPNAQSKAVEYAVGSYKTMIILIFYHLRKFQ